MSETVYKPSVPPSSPFPVDLDRLASVLTCAICFQNYNDTGSCAPRMLRCGHTFCIGCIDKMYERTTCRLQCPTCRRKVRLGNQGTSNLRRNYLAVELVEELKHARATMADCQQNGYVVCWQCGAFCVPKKLRSCADCDPSSERHFCQPCTREHHPGHAIVKATGKGEKIESKPRRFRPRKLLKRFNCFMG